MTKTLRFTMFVAAVAILGGCGDDSDTTATGLPDNPTPAECADALVTALNSFDTSGIDPEDGLDEAERATAEDRMAEVEEEYPFVADGGACADLLEAADAPEITSALIERVDPKVAAILGASAQEQFESVGESIGG